MPPDEQLVNDGAEQKEEPLLGPNFGRRSGLQVVMSLLLEDERGVRQTGLGVSGAQSGPGGRH